MHEIRIKIVYELYRREMSPTQWLEDFGGGSYGKVLAHFKALERHGWLRNVRSRKGVAGQGRERDLYRATELPVIDDETWAEMPISIQVAFTARGLRVLGERIGRALDKGSVDSSSSRLFCCRSFELDNEGWQAAIAAQNQCFFSFTQAQLDAKVRLDSSFEQGVLMTLALVGFESPRQGTSDNPALSRAADGSDVQPLYLSENGDVPLSARIARVFIDPLCLQILNEIQFEAMSPSQLCTKLGVAPLQSVDRKCQTLAKLGWATRVSEPGRRPVLYRATGPEAFDADLWAGVPDAAAKAASWPVFDEFCKKAEEAMRWGSFNARPDRHVTICTFLLDERGRKQVNEALRRCHDQLKAVDVAVRQRASHQSSPPYLATFFLAGFEDPSGKSD